MANDEHLKILKQGLEAWNRWRDENDSTQPNLSGAVLSGANLRSMDLRSADLTGANLRSADLKRADLSGANLTRTELSGANLTETRLWFANLSRTKLQNADFTKAQIVETIFARSYLSAARGLDSVLHVGPSYISIDTLYKSGGNIPEAFLRGCGLSDWEIESAKLYRRDLSSWQVTDITYRLNELRTNPAIQFNSCFISYSSTDQRFSERLFADLQDKGVRCWFAPEHMKIGDPIRNRIDEAIRLQDKLLLVLSKGSIESQWVEQEVETALEKERDQKRTVLCPIMLDKAVMSTNAAWASFIKNTRHVGDFSQWSNKDSYQKALERLLRDLRAEDATSQS
jgi:hypothetical protein